MDIAKIIEVRNAIQRNFDRLKTLGDWPSAVLVQPILDRVPLSNRAAGFDPVIACALDLIPRDKQKLAAMLYATGTEAAIEQVRREYATLDPESETCWWLVASFLSEDKVSQGGFLRQIAHFKALAESPDERIGVARDQWVELQKRFTFDEYGMPLSAEDEEEAKPAYLVGYEFDVMHSGDGFYLIETFRPSLGLERFLWKSAPGGQRQGCLLLGSPQLAMTPDPDEFRRALTVVYEHLG